MKCPTIQPSSKAMNRRGHGSIRRYKALWFAVAAILFVLTPRGWGQDNATINGTVVDASGALIPNAEISLTNQATSQVRTAVSNTAGAYRFANVGVGSFTLSVLALILFT